MTRREVERLIRQEDVLRALGFTRDEVEALRRISLTLHRWHERECGSDRACLVRGRMVNGTFEYDDDGHPYEEYAGLSGRACYHRVPDRERGAMTRLRAILGQRNGRPYISPGGTLVAGPADKLTFYIQGDPRGAALYILRPGDVPAGADVSSYYTRGICVY